MSPMTSSPFLQPLQCPPLCSLSPAQSTKIASLPQLRGHGRSRSKRQYSCCYDKKVALGRQKLDKRILNKEKKNAEIDHYFRYIRRQIHFQPELWYISPPDVSEEPPSELSVDLLINDSLASVGSHVGDKNELDDVRQFNAFLLAKETLLASKEAAASAQFNNFSNADSVSSYLPSVDEPTTIEKTIVRSGRLLERQSKKRKSLIHNSATHGNCSSKTTKTNIKVAKALNPNDPPVLLFWGPDTTHLLTIKEERALFNQIEEVMKIEEVKQKLGLQFGREPTMTEWADAVGMHYHELQSCIVSGKYSRDKMICANFRLVVHVAKHYQGNGLSLQDLLQVGSMGLMKSLERFKPKVGCRFPTYAYWWIRQSIKKAIFRNSRLIRLPENVFSLLKKIRSARMSCIRQGHHPSHSELAKCVGITVEKLEKLLFFSRNPVSIQDNAWTDQNITIQETTADPQVETPDVFIAKQLMRQHARNLLGVLPSRERQIIRFRYGLHDGEPKSLQDIGNLYGLSKERIRQLESRAMDKLKHCLADQGLAAYVYLLT